jgi:hypothetical protein
MLRAFKLSACRVWRGPVLDKVRVSNLRIAGRDYSLAIEGNLLPAWLTVWWRYPARRRYLDTIGKVAAFLWREHILQLGNLVRGVNYSFRRGAFCLVGDCARELAVQSGKTCPEAIRH